ncbi:MAG TPA: hypothetical protein VHE61_20895 [Opitutaceae bacterium]|nr:hypothetical protein [Opitutaceae bacterium]
MNSPTSQEAEAIRSDIEMTRRRMDDTINALGERMKGRHLLDEVIGFFRGSEDSSGTGAQVREKISQSAGTAAQAVVDTIKKNPVPVLLLTAGAAWLTYTLVRKNRAATDSSDERNEDESYDPAAHYDRPMEYPGDSMGPMDEGESKFEQFKDTVADKASSAKEQIEHTWSDLSGRTRDTLHSMRERAGEFGGEVQDRTREMCEQARDRIVNAADEHPLQIGLGCLVVGALIGLAVPTPEPVHRVAGPAVDRLKQRTRDAGRDMVQKGKRVVHAASDAARQEAESQGLTLNRMGRSSSNVADAATAAGQGAARPEPEPNPGAASGEQGGSTGPTDSSTAQPGA